MASNGATFGVVGRQSPDVSAGGDDLGDARDAVLEDPFDPRGDGGFGDGAPAACAYEQQIDSAPNDAFENEVTSVRLKGGADVLEDTLELFPVDLARAVLGTRRSGTDLDNAAFDCAVHGLPFSPDGTPTTRLFYNTAIGRTLPGSSRVASHRNRGNVVDGNREFCLEATDRATVTPW